MTAFIGRREFITLLGGAAAWPLAARAQQPTRMRRIGVLMRLAADDAEGRARVAAFLQGLQRIGLDRRPQRARSIIAGRAGDDERMRRACGGIGRARARTSSWPIGSLDSGRLLQATTHRADRVRGGRRSGRRRLRREPGAAGRQCHRLHHFRIRA